MQTTRPTPRERGSGRHASARRKHQIDWQQITQVRNHWPRQINWPRVRELSPPPVELLFLLGVVIPFMVVFFVVSGALGLLAALWTVT